MKYKFRIVMILVTVIVLIVHGIFNQENDNKLMDNNVSCLLCSLGFLGDGMTLPYTSAPTTTFFGLTYRPVIQITHT